MPPCTRPRGRVAVSICRLARSATQSGRANTMRWVLEFEPADRLEVDPLMGWLGSRDTRTQLRLTFLTRQSAVAFAERRRRGYTVSTPRERTARSESYGEQFAAGVTRAAA